MEVLAERQRSDTGSSSTQMVERDSLSNKPGGTVVEGRRSSKNGPNCWRCGKQGHFQRNCKERNLSGSVAVIAQNGKPPVRVLGQVDVEANAHWEVDATQTGSEIRRGTIDSTEGKRRPRRPRKGRRQRTERKRLKGGGDPPTNRPLWVKLNFKLGEVPSLVDTGPSFRAFAEM